MAEATCTAAGLIEAGSCFRQPLFGSHEQKAIIAYLWWKWADSVASVTTYANPTLLVAASQCISESLSQEKMVAGLIGVLNRGTDGLGTLSPGTEIEALTAATAATAIACLKEYDAKTLDGTILFNMCRFFSEFTS